MQKSASQVARWLRKRGLMIIQISVLLVFIAAFLIGGQRTATADTRQTSQVPSFYNYDSTAVDEIAAAEVAAAIAQASRLVVADSITNLADSLSAQVDLRDPEVEYYLQKPSLISTETKTNADISTYVVAAGDTIGSIAAKFNITSDTIRWANNLVGEAVAVGKELTILPISGVLYTVYSSDTAELLAQRYSANAQEIISFNDLELSGLVAGQQIIIPNGVVPPPVVSRYNYPAIYNTPSYGGNGYFYGYCTWHAANRRAQIGNPVPRNLGHALSWVSRAQAYGLPVGTVPQTGAVLWHKNTSIGIGYGHVAFVEEMLPDGSARVSDMNWASWNVVTERIVPPEEFGSYLFIY